MKKMLVGLALVTLVGCSQSPESPSTFESTAKFIEAMQQAGYSCQNVTTEGLTVSCGANLYFTVGDPTSEICTAREGAMDTYGFALDPSMNEYNPQPVEERKAEYTRFVGQPVILGQNWALWPLYEWSSTSPQIPWPADFDPASMAAALGGTVTTFGSLCQWPATLEEAQR